MKTGLTSSGAKSRLAIYMYIKYTLLMNLVGKEKARILRKQGKSINQIVAEAGLSKASVSEWTRDIVLTKAQKNKISLRGRSVESIEKRRINRLSNEKNKRQIIINNAKKDYAYISLEQLKLIGIILYLGEGSKTNRGTVAVANSDPDVIKIMARFLREVCKVSENKLRGHIHTFIHANIEKTEKYWSKISGMSRNQFYKTYTKPSSASLQKRQTLPFGTFSISVNDTKLFLTIMGWIEKIKELTVGNDI
jgi:hypothetical protein